MNWTIVLQVSFLVVPDAYSQESGPGRDVCFPIYFALWHVLFKKFQMRFLLTLTLCGQLPYSQPLKFFFGLFFVLWPIFTVLCVHDIANLKRFFFSVLTHSLPHTRCCKCCHQIRRREQKQQSTCISWGMVQSAPLLHYCKRAKVCNVLSGESMQDNQHPGVSLFLSIGFFRNS